MAHDPQIIIYPPKDTLERNVRFVCGALLGIFLAMFIILKVWPLSLFMVGSVIAVCVGLCGFLAVRYGDEFWRDAIGGLRGLF